ncbi:MAG: hypothetical protein ABIH28_01135 [archaeon]
MVQEIIKKGNKEYLIGEKRDLIIFNKIKELEKKGLNNQDKEVIKLIKTQLEKDWRKYLINYLKRLSTKYKK